MFSHASGGLSCHAFVDLVRETHGQKDGIHPIPFYVRDSICIWALI